MSYLSIGVKRAIRSPGILANRQEKIGLAKRLAAGAVKVLNIALTPLAPSGIKLELMQRKLVAPAKISAERLEVGQEFFKAFGNSKAREFVRTTLIKNYITAIMAHHPQADALRVDEISTKCERLVNVIFRRLEDIQHQPKFLFDVLKSMSRSANQEDVWFSEFDDAYANYKHQFKPKKRDEILSPFIVGDSLVDIGCGGGDQVAQFKAAHPERLKIVAGVDVLDWKTEGLDIDYHVLDFSKAGTVSPKKYDTGMLLAVLHHAGKTDQEIGTFLAGARTAVSKRLIVEENLIITLDDLKIHLPGMEGFEQQRRAQPTLDQYLKLDPQAQKDATAIVDLLGNSLSVGVPDMAFPFGFKRLGGWVKIFADNGFSVNRIKVLGFQRNYFNQQCHVIFALDKIE